MPRARALARRVKPKSTPQNRGARLIPSGIEVTCGEDTTRDITPTEARQYARCVRAEGTVVDGRSFKAEIEEWTHRGGDVFLELSFERDPKGHFDCVLGLTLHPADVDHVIELLMAVRDRARAEGIC